MLRRGWVLQRADNMIKKSLGEHISELAKQDVLPLPADHDRRGFYDEVAIPPGDITGLYGRMPPIFQKLVRKIADAPNYDFAAMELLDAFEIEWRKP